MELLFEEFSSWFANRCVCLEDKERWTPQQLLQHSFINIPRMKMPVAEENLDGKKLESFCILLNKWTTCLQSQKN